MSSATSHVSTQVRETVEALGELTSFCTWIGHECTIIFWYQKELGQDGVFSFKTPAIFDDRGQIVKTRAGTRAVVMSSHL
jgi:hypothetical protein